MLLVFVVLLFFVHTASASVCTDAGADADRCRSNMGCAFLTSTSTCVDGVDTACMLVPSGPTDFGDRCLGSGTPGANSNDCMYDSGSNLCYPRGHPSFAACDFYTSSPSVCESGSTGTRSGCAFDTSDNKCKPVTCRAWTASECHNHVGCYVNTDICKPIPIEICSSLTLLGSTACLNSAHSKCAWGGFVTPECYTAAYYPLCALKNGDAVGCAVNSDCFYDSINNICKQIIYNTKTYAPVYLLSPPDYYGPSTYYGAHGGDYNWNYLGSSTCTASCGGGTQINRYNCIVGVGPDLASDYDCQSKLGNPYLQGYPYPEACNTQICTGCIGYTTQGACGSPCYWDSYTPSITVGTAHAASCYNSVSQSNAMNGGCNAWTGISVDACHDHGCQFSDVAANTGLCILTTDGTGEGGIGADDFSVSAAFIDHYMETNTLTLHYSVVTPIIWSLSKPEWTINGIGPQWSTLLPGTVDPNSQCNSLPPGFTSPPSAITGYTGDFEALKLICKAWVDTNHNYNFPSNTNGDACRAILGGVLVGGTDIMVKQISFVNINTIRYDIKIDLQMAQTCADAHKTEYPTYTLYELPTTLSVRTVDNSAVTMTNRYLVTVQQDGSISISATRAYKITQQIINPGAERSSCSAGYQRLNATISLSYVGVSNSSIKVGPRNMADVVTVSPLDGVTGGCYGDTVTGLISYPYDTLNQAWRYLVHVQSACTLITPEGTAFDTCATAAQPGGPYSGSLDKLHGLWVNTQCCIGTLCTSCNAAPGGEHDYIYNTYTLSVYPDTSVTHRYRVSGGILPTPLSTLANERVLGTSNPQFVNLSETRNLQLTNEKTMTYFIRLDPEIYHSYNLTLLTADFTITPLSATGERLTSSAILTWDSIHPYLDYGTRAMALTEGATMIAACGGISGCDGFSIPVRRLQILSPAAGYELHITYHITLSTTSHAVSLSTHHKEARLFALAAPNTQVLAGVIQKKGAFRKQDVTTTTTVSGGELSVVLHVAVDISLLAKDIRDQDKKEMKGAVWMGSLFPMLFTYLAVLIVLLYRFDDFSKCGKKV